MGLVFPALIAAFLIGFFAGRRIGKNSGIKLGEKYCMLEQRKKLWEAAVCPVCGTIVANGDETENKRIFSCDLQELSDVT